MPNIITIKVDVSKLDKSRFFRGKPDRDGHEPVWCDLVLFPRRELGKYGDTHFVKQSKRKDEEADLPIIGNGTERESRYTAPTPSGAKPALPPGVPAPQIPPEDLPF